MYILLYVVAVISVIIGSIWSYYTQDTALLGSGLLSGVLFGSLGKIVHLLSQIEDHLNQSKEDN